MLDQMRRFIAKNKKLIMLLVIVLVLIIVFPMILLNFLIMSWTTEFTYGDSTTWLNIWGAVIAAVVGGFISGGLTLSGVVLTIEDKEKKDFISNYAIKNTMLDDITAEVLDVLRAVNIYKRDKDNEEFNATQYLVKLKSLLEMRRVRFGDLLRISAEVDYQLYKKIRQSYTINLETLYFQLGGRVDINELRLEQIERELEECHSLIMDVRISLVDRYNKYN